MESEQVEARISDLAEMVKVQCYDGTWNYDPYMHGLANGLIFGLAIMKNEEPKFLEAPEVWGKDKKPNLILLQDEKGIDV
jgi:hypothetical protein